MRRGYGYTSYRGRMTMRKALTILVVVLAVILVLLVAVYAALQRYVIYSDSGTHIELPFFQKPQPEPSGENIQIVVESPSAQPTESTAPEQTKPEFIHAVQLPEQTLLDGGAEAYAQQAGANTVVVDLKGADGSLGYQSQLELAAQAGANPENGEERNRAIETLNQGELYTVARICCFRDELLHTVDRSYNILTNSGYLWRDESDVCWVSPASEQVRAYLVGIAREAAELGFDEILLDYAGYPTQGQLGWIKVGESYPTGSLDSWITQFYQEVAQALEPYEVKLSIRTTQQALEGTDERSGQTAENLAAWADGVWLERPQSLDACVDALRTAGAQQAEEMLVFLTGEAGGQEESWAILP